MKSYKALLVLVTVLFLAQGFLAQDSEVNINDAKYCMEEGIYSPDKEVRKKSFYTLFKENKTDAMPVLIERLDKEDNDEVRMVIARVIYMFGQTEGIEALEQVAWEDDNLKIRHLCRSLCVDFANNNPDSYNLDLERLDRVLADASK